VGTEEDDALIDEFNVDEFNVFVGSLIYLLNKKQKYLEMAEKFETFEGLSEEDDDLINVKLDRLISLKAYKLLQSCVAEVKASIILENKEVKNDN